MQLGLNLRRDTLNSYASLPNQKFAMPANPDGRPKHRSSRSRGCDPDDLRRRLYVVLAEQEAQGKEGARLAKLASIERAQAKQDAMQCFEEAEDRTTAEMGDTARAPKTEPAHGSDGRHAASIAREQAPEASETKQSPPSTSEPQPAASESQAPPAPPRRSKSCKPAPRADPTKPAAPRPRTTAPRSEREVLARLSLAALKLYAATEDLQQGDNDSGRPPRRHSTTTTTAGFRGPITTADLPALLAASDSQETLVDAVPNAWAQPPQASARVAARARTDWTQSDEVSGTNKMSLLRRGLRLGRRARRGQDGYGKEEPEITPRTGFLARFRLQ
ncbi:hypothetical protein F4780DRAFT_229341 [Xylariomycetidae sp. FL0641]|nr:hypothetical protein F4780DRAFT_229341 [Xylariomycetidae sp. FL0641]